MYRRRLTRPAALGLTLALLTAPTATAQQDLRSPDALDAATAQERHSSHGSKAAERLDNPWQDVPSPLQDLRSPDTRDAGAGRGTFNAPEVTVVKVPQPSPDGGIDWADAGIGAGGLLGLILLALAATFAVHHRGRGGTGRRQTATTS